MACVIFAGDSAGIGQQTKLGSLVLEPMTKFKKAIECLTNHGKHVYHAEAVTRMEAFVQTAHDPDKSVDMLISSKRKEQVDENRRLLVPIIETVLLCGKNMLPLRGHRDDGPIDLDASGVAREGVFRALLPFRVHGGDAALKKLLTTSARNSTLISKTTQEELIAISGKAIV